MNEKSKAQLEEIFEEVSSQYDTYKNLIDSDLTIDPESPVLDEIVLETPKMLSKYSNLFNKETMVLKDLYLLKKKIEHERWLYYSGKQTDKYYAQNGVCHEKILKSDVDRYLSVDEKVALINKVVNKQKTICDHIERAIKEIQSRNFHCKVAMDWRKYTTGAV